MKSEFQSDPWDYFIYQQEPQQSAYEYAVSTGFEGSFDEWLSSELDQPYKSSNAQ